MYPFEADPDGEGGLIQTNIPFSTSDQCNWKSHSKGLREDPDGFLSLIRRIFWTHDPSWADIQSLLNVPLTMKEKVLIFSKVREEAKRPLKPSETTKTMEDRG